MSLTSLPAIVMASISFTVGVLHLLFYFRQKTRTTDLTFGITAVLVGAYAGLCAGLYSSDSVAEGSLWLHWQLIIHNAISFCFFWFVVDYTKLAGKRTLAFVFVAFGILAVFGAINPGGMVVTNEPLVKTVNLWGDASVTYYETELGAIGNLQVIAMQINYLVLLGLSVAYSKKVGFRKGGFLVAAMGLFLLSTAIDAGVVMGFYEFVYTIEYAFIGVVIFMAYSLSSELRESVKAKEQLQKSQERFDLAVRGSSDGLWDWREVDRDEVWFSPRFYELLGYRDKEFAGSFSWFEETLHPEDRDETIHAHFKHLYERLPYDQEYRLKTKSGDYKWFRARGQAVWNDAGEPVRMAGSIQDITEQKTAQEELVRSEKTLKTVLNSAPVGIGMAMNRRMFNVNKKLLELTGYSRDDLEGCNSSKMYESETEFLKVGNQIYSQAQSGGIGAVESRWKRRDGTLFDVLLIVSPIEDRDISKGVVFMVMDISERKEAERERERLVQALSDKNEQLEGIIHVSSHDLRSPLVNIQGFSAELQKSCEELAKLLEDEEVPEGLREKLVPILTTEIPMSMRFISSSADKMDSLMKSLLKLSRLGRQELNPVKLDMNKLLGDILDGMRYQIQECEAKVEVADLPACEGDRTALDQVFSNLIDNAIKYRDTNRPLEIHIEGKEEGGDCIYAIRDNGVGIPQEHQKRVFEIFHRLQPDGHVSGEGMGLTIVRRIIERHNGDIWVESTRGEGSSFFVELPKA
ncbi:Phytochrome-like protein cph1 [Anaerohalosphaera lusitana]|uniref:histidine kinase n=1 Tax=Anaerohalosphaera lusitana TaxID=1936003 RepID=A0A1U9NP53_9BACT|nr:PAS domain S-box protein [Anaerohalosphaera lusitana]AQT69693.1 Phytochrome-like protein cph1 [Anaerohalosphaera lusitana]